ncbi:DUF4260 domain-containing protein [Moheibacter sediminis]|uniref:DUF4260 domain-containing protein n=1 Tax=Moheibacter sediminis TaxID=1434700 RepID=A0A1W2BBE5_9FLAO|nr:DUF4260 domain-containing protein [Moheibacter sediminis]SMC70164.1 protein of unknown function [Moheibacter sediminis]
MKAVVSLENLGLFILSIYLFSLLEFSWWWFPALLLLPDLSMLGYACGNKFGAIVYNLFHHQGLAILVYLSGVYFENEFIQLVGIILFAHSVMDRIFGYGLKHFAGFHDTHLGRIGKK